MVLDPELETFYNGSPSTIVTAAIAKIQLYYEKCAPFKIYLNHKMLQC